MTAQLLTLDEAAELLRMTPQRLSRMARRQQVPSINLPGDQIRFDASALADWIDSHRSPAKPSKVAP